MFTSHQSPIYCFIESQTRLVALSVLQYLVSVSGMCDIHNILAPRAWQDFARILRAKSKVTCCLENMHKYTPSYSKIIATNVQRESSFRLSSIRIRLPFFLAKLD